MGRERSERGHSPPERRVYVRRSRRPAARRCPSPTRTQTSAPRRPTASGRRRAQPASERGTASDPARAESASWQAVRNARDHADIILYLVNAAEDPAGAAYVPLEMELLAWIGKPVVLLLNQMGRPRSRDTEAAEETAWSAHLAAFVTARESIALDAFARCWIQEATLLRAMHGLESEAA